MGESLQKRPKRVITERSGRVKPTLKYMIVKNVADTQNDKYRKSNSKVIFKTTLVSWDIRFDKKR